MGSPGPAGEMLHAARRPRRGRVYLGGQQVPLQQGGQPLQQVSADAAENVGTASPSDNNRAVTASNLRITFTSVN